jgi:hypothetical protein
MRCFVFLPSIRSHSWKFVHLHLRAVVVDDQTFGRPR